MENKIYLGDASSSSMMDKYGVKVGIVDENKENEKRIEVILHKQDSIIQKLEKEAQNDFK